MIEDERQPGRRFPDAETGRGLADAGKQCSVFRADFVGVPARKIIEARKGVAAHPGDRRYRAILLVHRDGHPVTIGVVGLAEGKHLSSWHCWVGRTDRVRDARRWQDRRQQQARKGNDESHIPLQAGRHIRTKREHVIFCRLGKGLVGYCVPLIHFAGSIGTHVLAFRSYRLTSKWR